jgi:hypothetical protein
VDLRLNLVRQFLLVLLLAVWAISDGMRASAQAVPTASAAIHLSAFAGISGNFTGLVLAKNADVTGGIDVGFGPFAGFYPSVEARGLYPVAQGHTVALRNLLGGVRLGRSKGPLHGYGDVLFGRGQLNYLNGGLPNPSRTLLYEQTTGNVLSLGGGCDWDWTQHFGLKGDFQFQRYQTPVTASGNLFSKVFTAAIMYRFGSGSVR